MVGDRSSSQQSMERRYRVEIEDLDVCCMVVDVLVIFEVGFVGNCFCCLVYIEFWFGFWV